MLTFSKIICCRSFLFCVLAIFCFYQTTHAQSGRRVGRSDSSSAPSPPALITEKTEKDTLADGVRVRISSLIVVGEVQHNFAYYDSNTADIALKELVRTLKSYPKSVSEITRGDGKMSYKEAQEQAAKETETFVLWLGFLAKSDSFGNTYVDSVQYAVLTPKNAKVVTRGEIEPEADAVLGSGGILNIPKTTRRSAATELSQMKKGARQVAAILARGGWLE